MDKRTGVVGLEGITPGESRGQRPGLFRGAGFPLSLELGSTDLPRKSWVKISQIRVLAVESIGAKIAEASAEELAQVVEGLNEIVG